MQLTVPTQRTHRVLMSFTFRKGWHVCFFEGDRNRQQLPRLAFFNSDEVMVDFTRRAGGPKTLEDRNIFAMIMERGFGEITLESLVRGQQRLFGDVSHELRSPLARLSVAEGLLRQCPPGERPEYLDRIALEVEHLDQLIGQLLTLARIDSGADSSRTERVELSSLIQEVAVDGNFEAQAKYCSVKVDSMEACATTGAREQLRRAIENVVRNAIRYTQPSTDVKITLRKQYAPALSRAVIQIRDHGPGVTREHLEKIFLPFYRIPTIHSEPAVGAGLGLAITERIVQTYGGSVSATNAPDGGLIVNLELLLTD